MCEHEDRPERGRCKACKAVADKARSKRLRDVRRIQARVWVAANPEKVAISRKKADAKRSSARAALKAALPARNPLVCSGCGDEKTENDFGFYAPGKPRRQCKSCVQAVFRANYVRDAVVRARAADQHRAWRAANPEASRERNRRSVASRPDEARAYSRAYHAAHPEYAAKSNAKRRSRLAKCTLPLSDSHRDVMALIYAEAAEMTRLTGVPHHVDHIVPLRGKLVSGLHVPWNLQVLTWRDNLRKGNSEVTR